MSLPEATKKPCNDCPWRRNAAPGWLGPLSGDEWILLAHSDEPIACHITIEREDDWETPGIKQCKGASIYRANMAKSPRDPEIDRGTADRETVFATRQEFLDYHAKGA
jgi:hypothetical protein